MPSARGIGALDSADPDAHRSRGTLEQRLAVPQRTDGRLMVGHRMAPPRADTQDLDSTEDTVYLARVRAVVCSGAVAQSSGLAPVV